MSDDAKQRAERIERAREYYETHEPQPTNGYWVSKAPAISMMADFAAADPPWHKIETDGLPKRDGEWQVTTVDGKVRIAWYIRRKEVFVTLDGGECIEAIAYKPVPEPFREEGEERVSETRADPQ